MKPLEDPRLLSLSGKVKWALGAVAVILFGALSWLYLAPLI